MATPGRRKGGADADMKAGEAMDTCSGAVMRPKDVDAVSTVVRGILQTCCIRRGRRGGDTRVSLLAPESRRVGGVLADVVAREEGGTP